MRWLKAKIKNMSIRFQIQFSILAISMLFTGILGLFAYQIASNAIESNYREDFSYNLSISNTIFEIQADNIIELIRNLLTEDVFMDTLAKSDEAEGRYFSSYESRVFESFAASICLQEISVDEILVVGLDGKLFQHSKMAGSSYTDYYRGKNAVEMDWADAAKGANGKEVFFSNNVLKPEEDSKDLSIVKYMIDPYSTEPVGYVIANVRKKMLQKAFSSKGGYETNCFLVVDNEAAYPIIYFQGNPDYREKILEEYLRQQAFGEEKSEQTYVFSTYTNERTGWSFISVIERKELSRASNRIRTMIVIAMLLLMVCSVVIASVVSRHIYEPLQKLERTIEQVGEGNRHITEQFDGSEIGLLGDKFKRMVNHNLELRERLLVSKIREREAELYLLQEQINPHFLYNTLDSLYCMAVIHDADDIAKMVEALSNTFRLSLNKGNNRILVRDELKHIENYMVVQNMRYNDRFHLDVQVEEALMDVRIQKLLLEPFVENAVYHGLETKIGEGTVKIRGWLEGEEVYFIIEDDGVGVEDLSLMEKGFGITNVRERIHLFYGEKYGVTFESRKDEGTKVTVHICVVGDSDSGRFVCLEDDR
ncbi:MAG: sensor histidine kinase [Candidatus Limivivens sp.]|nr:sensor histidine kinase [Candidatus Limivivens sp.]